MKQGMIILILLAGFISCRKDPKEVVYPPQPAMHYTDLGNKEVRFNDPKGVDMDGDGALDFWFTTWYIGDPLLQRDIKQFHVASGTHSALLAGNNNNSPIYLKGSTILNAGFGDYEWHIVSLVELAQKIIPVEGPSFWQGLWKNVQHRYLAVQLERAGLTYNGWIEVSFNTTEEKLVLHKAAISTEPTKDVRAGY